MRKAEACRLRCFVSLTYIFVQKRTQLINYRNPARIENHGAKKIPWSMNNLILLQDTESNLKCINHLRN